MPFSVDNYKNINKVALYVKIPTKSIYGDTNATSSDGDDTTWKAIRNTLSEFLFGANACTHLNPAKFCKEQGLVEYEKDETQPGGFDYSVILSKHEDKINDIDQNSIYNFYVSLKNDNDVNDWQSYKHLGDLITKNGVNNDSTKKKSETNDTKESVIDFGLEAWKTYYSQHGLTDIDKKDTVRSKVFEANTVLGSGTIDFNITPKMDSFNINSFLTNNGILGTALKAASAATGFCPVIDMPQTSSFNGVDNMSFTFKCYIDLEESLAKNPDLRDCGIDHITKTVYNDPIARLYGLLLPIRDSDMPINTWLDAMFNEAGGRSGDNDKYKNQNEARSDNYWSSLAGAIKTGKDIREWCTKNANEQDPSLWKLMGEIGTKIGGFIAEYDNKVYDMFGDTYMLRPPFMYQRGIDEDSRSVDVRIGSLQIQGCIIKSVNMSVPTFTYEGALPPYVMFTIQVETNRMPNVALFSKLFKPDLYELEMGTNAYKKYQEDVFYETKGKETSFNEDKYMKKG